MKRNLVKDRTLSLCPFGVTGGDGVYIPGRYCVGEELYPADETLDVELLRLLIELSTLSYSPSVDVRRLVSVLLFSNVTGELPLD